MKIVFKKYSLLFLSLLITLLVVSCSAKGPIDVVDGNFFIYSGNFKYDNHLYEIYSPVEVNLFTEDGASLNSELIFTYTEKEKIDASTWIINYYDYNDYIVTKDEIDKELLDVFYDNVKESLKEYEKTMNIEFLLNYDHEQLEKEFVIDSEIEYDSILLIDLYIPFKINGYQTFNVYVPVKTFLAYRNNNTVVLKHNEYELSMPYEVFVSLSNVKEK